MNDRLSHRDVFDLVPWYVNGTLPDRQREEVARHLTECLTCRLAVAQEQRLYATMRAHAESSPFVEQGFESLIERLDEPGRRKPAAGLSVGVFGSWRPLDLGWAAAAILLITVGLGVWLTAPWFTEPAGSFVTATDSSIESPNRLDLVFASDLDDAARRELLDEIDATIVAGPTEIGRYTIEFADPGADLGTRLSALRKDPRIRFIGVAYSGVGADR